jgi:hypothetical protein
MVPAMRLSCLLPLLGVLLLNPLAAAPLAQPEWNRVDVGAMKTSIYIGSVTLQTSAFKSEGNLFSATYSAKVFPWVFWNETGRITIKITEEDFRKLKRGERCEFSGDALNHKNKPRHVTGYADPASDGTGKIKVRIGVDDTDLIFNGNYTLSTVSYQASSAQ